MPRMARVVLPHMPHHLVQLDFCSLLQAEVDRLSARAGQVPGVAPEIRERRAPPVFRGLRCTHDRRTFRP